MPDPTNIIECFVFIREVPMASIPSTIGQGPSVPIVLNITTLGVHDFSDIGVPPGVDVTVTLVGGGGGGGGAPVAGGIGGGGGGGGAAVIVLIPAATWALDGVISLGTAGDGGIATDDGMNAVDCTITMADGVVTCVAAAGGLANGGAGGDGGAVDVLGTGYTIITSRPGRQGTAGAASGAAPGGASGFFQGAAGGAGGVAPDGDGLDGQPAYATVSFSV